MGKKKKDTVGIFVLHPAILHTYTDWIKASTNQLLVNKKVADMINRGVSLLSEVKHQLFNRGTKSSQF